MAATKPQGKSATRHARVKQILGDAANGAKADYGLGGTPFWQLDLDDLLRFSLFGVRLIAPPTQPSCCAEDGVPYCRSAASGLIKGLRGEAPFDFSRLPRLPWGDGARPVAEDDIGFIADWIDDGCPPDDHLHEMEIAAEESDIIGRIKVGDIQEFGVANDARRGWRQGEPRQRANLDCLSEAEIASYRLAFRNLYSIDKAPSDRRSYNNQALVHQNHCQHGWERFLPWHRAYLYEFEQNLLDVSPNSPALPYWDWTMPYYWNDGDPAGGPVIPNAFKAYVDRPAFEVLAGKIDLTAAQKKAFDRIVADRKLFTSQHEFFCYVINTIGYTDFTPDPANPNRRALLDALIDSNPLWYPLRYPAQYAGGGTIESVIHYHYPSPADMAQIESLNNFRDFGGGNEYNASFGFLDQNPHNTMHIWTGGMNPDYGLSAYNCGMKAASLVEPPAHVGSRRSAMVQAAGRAFHTREDMYSQPQFGDMFSNLTASFDPVFWPIHVNVDRIWSEWQRRNPNGLPADLDSVLSPWSYTIRDTLNTDVFGYEYVRGTFFMPVGMEAPVGRFVSKPIPVTAKLKEFKKAEVRLHWVPQLDRSCFIRVFLNQPGADASTKITGNPHYAGYIAVFGHGACYGAPGHCDLPPQRARSFDVRPRHHNTPRNHRIDVTAAARELLKKKDTLQITLLVIGVDYREDPDLLKLEGVSLNFLD